MTNDELRRRYQKNAAQLKRLGLLGKAARYEAMATADDATIEQQLDYSAASVQARLAELRAGGR